MWTFILTILVFNLIFIVLLFFIRHLVAITTPVLVLTALVAFGCTVALPYLAAVFDYGSLAVVFCLMILCAAALLTMADKKYPASTLAAGGEETTEPGEIAETGDLTEIPEAAEIQAVIEAREDIEPLEVTETGEELTGTPEQEEPLETSDTRDELTETLEQEEPLETSDTRDELTETLEQEEPLETSDTRDELTETLEQEEPLETSDTRDELTEIEDIIETEDVTETEDMAEDQKAAEFAEETQPLVAAEPLEATEPKNLTQLIDTGFARKQRGDYLGAAVTFFRALQMQPGTKLSVLLTAEVSDIYREANQFWQAAEILKTLLKSRRGELDRETVDRLEIRINQLHELQKEGV